MSGAHDETHMAEAIRLARQAEGHTRPNPMVGCVVVRGGEIISTGYHRRAGEAHGEQDALRKLKPGEATGSTLYVNLEPCCTHGRTPPCTDAILRADIARVVVGTVDTNPNVKGAGIARLREAGIEVAVGVLDAESRRLNAAYFKTMEAKRPLVVAKWAMSADGKIATRTRDSAWITNNKSRDYVHALRARYDAVLVGTGTLVDDDPRLTCRIDGGRDPIRVVLDRTLRSDPMQRAFANEGTIVVHDESLSAVQFAPFADRGAVSLGMPVVDDVLDLEATMRALLDHDVMSVLVEGGGDLLGSLFDAALVDRVYAFVAPRIIGGIDAVSPVAGRGIERVAEGAALTDVRIEMFGDDVLIVGEVS